MPLLDGTQGPRFFTKLDSASSYYQQRVQPAGRGPVEDERLHPSPFKTRCSLTINVDRLKWLQQEERAHCLDKVAEYEVAVPPLAAESPSSPRHPSRLSLSCAPEPLAPPA